MTARLKDYPDRATGYGTIPDKGPVDLASARMRRIDTEPHIGAVEQDVPLPGKLGRQPSEMQLAVRELKVGESRLFVNVKPSALYGHCKTARHYGYGQEYAVRIVDGGVRVWRVK